MTIIFSRRSRHWGGRPREADMRDQNDKNDKAVRPASHKGGPTADVRRFDEPAPAEAPNR
jgi:hypothetical protein